MQVYAFVGKTGTGKSYNALKVAKSLDIKYIIDDAILINETKVIAGRSAKTEASKIASVKAAIFLYEDRRNEMIKAIKKEKIAITINLIITPYKVIFILCVALFKACNILIRGPSK